jgi:hypothetical protein
MGSPFPLSEAQHVQLEKAGRLGELGQPEAINVGAGKAIIQLDLPRQAVTLLLVNWN